MDDNPINVLLIEDNPGDVFLIEEMLGRAKGVCIESVCADRLSTGFEVIGKGGIDVILIDLSLPDSLGLVTFDSVIARAPDLPVIVLSGLDDEELAVEAVEKGAQDYLVKGRVDSDLLVRAIRYAITRKEVEEALRASEEKYRLLVENANEAIVVAQDGVLKFSNPNAAILTGYSEEELSSRPFIDFIHPDDRAMVADRYVKRLKGEEVPHSYPFRVIDRTGNIKWVEIKAVRIEWDGKPATLNFMSDITERKKAEDAIQQQNRFLGNILESLTHPFYVIDSEDYSIKLANSEARAGDIIEGQTCYGLTHNRDNPCDGAEHTCPVLEVKRTKKPVVVEHIHYSKDGKARNMEVHAYPILNEEGEVEKVIEYSMDITVRKQAEDALIESEEKLRRILESSPDAITVTDLDGNIIECNQATLDMHGFSCKDEAMGINTFDYITKRDQTKAMEVMMETLDQGHSKHMECSLRTRDGREFPAELSTSVIKDPNGNPTSFVAITKNITERKRAEEKLIQSEKLAGIGTLASGIAHEVNNPLAGIMGYAEIMQEEENLDKIREYTQKILKNTKRASDIVRWLSRYSREARDTNIKNVNLQEVIVDAMEALTHTRRSSDVEVIKDFQRIPTIKGNRSELLQIFVNLMNNAVDAMPKGGRLNLTSVVNDGIVEVRVSDNGVGIPKNQINKVFDPFFTTKEVGKGTGLGLYVINMLVKKHHGIIEVDSEVGEGTTFTMRFPPEEVTG